MTAQRALVIGASGFTGSRVLRQAPEGWTVYGMVRSAAAATAVSNAEGTPVEGDLDQPESVAAALQSVKPAIVIVTASLGFGHAPSLVETLESYGPDRVVFTSTTGIFTKLNPASKAVRLAAEETIEESNLSWITLRPTMIYGRPGDRNMERLLRYLARVPVLPAPNGGNNLQQPVHVDDLADALWSAGVSTHLASQAVNVPGPDALHFREIVEGAAHAVGRRGQVVPVPVGPVRQIMRLRERVDIGPNIKVEQIDRLVEDKAFDVQPASELLDHRPRSFVAGIEDEAALLGLVA
ncbi:MAG: NAD(P)-dependent oxidoreductase [Acidimicrobiales bacterium]